MHHIHFFSKLINFFQSDNCSLCIPELDCEVGPAALAGRFTTIEGILEAIKDQLSESGAMFRDSEDSDSKDRMDRYVVVTTVNYQIENILNLLLYIFIGGSAFLCHLKFHTNNIVQCAFDNISRFNALRTLWCASQY